MCQTVGHMYKRLCLSVCLSVCKSVCHANNTPLSACLSACLSVCLSVCLLPHDLEEDAADAPDVHLVRVVTVRQ